MATTSYEESDAKQATSLSRHFPGNESDAENDGFKNRVKRAMGDEKARSFARRAGISESVLRQYIKGESLPTLDKLRAIADTANVNLLWLATGEGLMRGESVVSSMPCSVDMKMDALVRALALVESVKPDAPLEQKAKAVAMAYALIANEGRPLDADAIRLVVESLVK